MPQPVLKLADLQPQPRAARWMPPEAVARRIEVRRAPVGDPLGLTTLGANLTVVPPGKAAYPHHSHYANDELFVILEGRGELRLGEARHPLAAGDVVGCPKGDAMTAHQIVNTGDDDLRYLSVSCKRSANAPSAVDDGVVDATYAAACSRASSAARVPPARRQLCGNSCARSRCLSVGSRSNTSLR